MPPHTFYILGRSISQSVFLPQPTAPFDSTFTTSPLLPSLHDKTYLITGGYSGVGEAVSSLLYSRHATVWIAGRDSQRAAKVMDEIKATYQESEGRLEFLKVDFSDLETIKPAVEEFVRRNEILSGGGSSGSDDGKNNKKKKRGGNLHWLNNNAGIMFPPKNSRGKQGHDATLVTNIYGPFLLTKLLLPVLQETAAAEASSSSSSSTSSSNSKPGAVRVSWAGSSASYLTPHRGGIKWTTDGKELVGAYDDPQGIYSVSKAANWYLGHEFARRAEDGNGDGVLHNSYNPGNLRTSLQRTTSQTLGAIVYFVVWNFICRWTGVYGAYTELYAGLSPDLTLSKTNTKGDGKRGDDQGAWIVPWGKKDTMRPDLVAELEKGDDGIGARLWDFCEEITKEYQ